MLPSSLLKQIDLSLNPTVDISKLSSGSNKIIIWTCDKNHNWEARVKNRSRGQNCPICSNRKILVGFNDLATTHPELVSQWSDKNILTPLDVTSGSKKKILWTCDKKHEWETTVKHRSSGQNCPVCVNRKTIPGFNDLATTHPELVSQWSDKNTLTPLDVTSGSELTVKWFCDKNHEWEAKVSNRTVNKTKCPICSNRKILSGFNDLATTHPELVSQWSDKNTLTPLDVTSGSEKQIIWLCKKNHKWATTPNSRTYSKTGCPICNPKFSLKEKEISAFIASDLNIHIEENRKILDKKEVDIYIPGKNIAVEFNGLYWHSEKFKTKTYHYDKWLACKNAGIQLIQIWEDDWNRNPELVKRMLARKIGVKQDVKVYARNTFTKTIIKREAEEFLKQNHIQGYSQGSYYLGLFDKRDIEKLVAVLVLKKEPGTNGKTLNIIRYATSQNVVGGFTKLLKYAEKTYEPERFITFSDNCVSDGGLYENNGFIADKELAPDYMYVVKGERKHKFGYRLKRFSNDPELQYQPGLTERELAALNGLHRVWDAGKTRWIKKI